MSEKKRYSVSKCDTTEDGECEQEKLEEFDTIEEAKLYMAELYNQHYPVVDIWASELYLYEDDKQIASLTLN